jgi:hypothetical protein
MLRRFDCLAGKVSSLLKPAMIGLGVCLLHERRVFRPRLAHGPSELLLHSGHLILQEAEYV